MIYGIVIGCVLLIGIIYAISIYNEFIKIKNKIEEAGATVEVYLKKRYDLVPNLVETVKGYAKHEKQTFTAVIEARSKVMSAVGFEEMIQSENILKKIIKVLFALAENYPELETNQKFIDVQKQLTKVEDDILQSRKHYNGVVKSYNIKTETFPDSLVASWFKYIEKDYYKIKEEVREDINIK